jgi:hypothetical protein
MTKKELLKKDLPLLTATTTMANAAYLRTLIQMQANVISLLTKQPLSDVMKQVNQDIKDNTKIIHNLLDKGVDDIDILAGFN